MVTNQTISNEVFRAIADPTRRAILDLLQKGAQPVNTIADTFPVSRPAISRHLRLLREADLVVGRRNGRLQLYQLNAAPLANVEEWLGKYRQMWQRSLGKLKAFAESEERRRKK